MLTQSLGQGNVFTPVYHSVHRGRSASGGVCMGGRWADPTSNTMGYAQRAGGTHPTGMHSS